MIGNCQAHVISQCLMTINRRVQSVSYPSNRSADFGPEIADNDFIFATRFADRPLEDVVPSIRGKIIYYPRVTFPAFTPDITYAQAGGDWVQSPLGDYNSLVLYGWRAGLPVNEIRALFCGDIFRASASPSL